MKSRPKQIVFLLGAFRIGGTERRASLLADELCNNGYDVTLLAFEHFDEEAVLNVNQNVKRIVLEDFLSSQDNHNDIARSEKKLNKRLALLKKLQILFRCLPDVSKKIEIYRKKIRNNKALHCFLRSLNNPVCITLEPFYFEKLYYASEKVRCKLIYSEAFSPERRQLTDEWPSFRFITEKLLKCRGMCVCQTAEQLKYYKKILPSHRCVIIHNPLASEALPQPWHGDREKIIVNYCRINPQKNLKLLIDAFEIFHRSHNDFRLEIYGYAPDASSQKLKADLIEYSSQCGLQDSVFFLPSRQGIHDCVLHCAMFVMSSDYEGISNSMLEAMAIGLPCVCTDCYGGGTREIIRNEVSGLIVPMNDAQAMADAMCRFADEPSLAKECSVNAAKIRTELSSKTICRQWENLF